jgi:hypothetical protein
MLTSRNVQYVETTAPPDAGTMSIAFQAHGIFFGAAAKK